MSNDHGCDASLNRFFNQSESSHCKTLLRNAFECCNACGRQHVRCSGLERSGEGIARFQCPRCISKAAHDDCNVHPLALPTDPYAKNQDHTTHLPPRKGRVFADNANDGHIVLATPPKTQQKTKSLRNVAYTDRKGRYDWKNP